MKSSSGAAKVLIINASMGGETGNCAGALAMLERALSGRARTRAVTLAKRPARAKVKAALRWADGFVFASGTHWDSWSSHLQEFLEAWTDEEGSALWLGKPVAVVITEHSTGGKGVLSRLQGVLNTFGCSVPPMSGIVLSKVAQIAVTASPADGQDFWRASDLGVVAHNLCAAMDGRTDWKTWPVDLDHVTDRWWAGR